MIEENIYSPCTVSTTVLSLGKYCQKKGFEVKLLCRTYGRLTVAASNSVVDPYPDPDWIRIRIQEGKNDPQN
jgi:hypothetical protein